MSLKWHAVVIVIQVTVTEKTTFVCALSNPIGENWSWLICACFWRQALCMLHKYSTAKLTSRKDSAAYILFFINQGWVFDTRPLSNVTLTSDLLDKGPESYNASQVTWEWLWERGGVRHVFGHEEKSRKQVKQPPVNAQTAIFM